MGLLKDLQDAGVEQRKAMVAKTGGEHASFIAMVLADIYAVAKRDGSRAATDDDVDPILRTHIRQNKLLLSGDPSTNIPPLPDSDYRTMVSDRIGYLTAFLPPPVTGDALVAAIREVSATTGKPPVSANIDAIMQALKAQFGNRVDGAEVKAVLQAGV